MKLVWRLLPAILVLFASNSSAEDNYLGVQFGARALAMGGAFAATVCGINLRRFLKEKENQ